MQADSIQRFSIIKVNEKDTSPVTDELAIEEPLEIRVSYLSGGQQLIKNISVTMRTPGHDAELAIGFLFTEGIYRNKEILASVDHCFIACAENKENVIQVTLNEIPALQNAERNFYTTSSCGVCGKGSIAAIRTVSVFQQEEDDQLFISQETLNQLPLTLQKQQEVFQATGGLHASALFTPSGELLFLREDVGRHNALDKLIGAALTKDLLPLTQTILLLSGRVSFELVQKAAMAGIRIILPQ
ncbi:formate dehydrogenase accessory sulfurtransferase FdhD [Pedobacter sp. NJ-S-72]